MRFLRLFFRLTCCLAICVALSRADSIQLRNGRRLQGKYIGGTTTAVGFMTAATVEYFPTSEVVVLMFDGGNDVPGEGLQPDPMSGGGPGYTPGTMHTLQNGVFISDSKLPFARQTMDTDNDTSEWLAGVQGLGWLRDDVEHPAGSML